jgi:hypothetical protein
MDRDQQKKPEDNPIISPLANDKTYGERVYARVFDWGLNYWTNLISSAAFSQWAEHGTRKIKIPFLMKEAASPSQIQHQLAERISKTSFLNGLRTASGEAAAMRRSMAVARSMTLLTPGFFVMVPSVWLGAKIKPWFVKTFNRRHYGEEAMDDPSLQARHEAIEAEERPTFSGTLIARLLTAAAVQFAAFTIGSDKNWLNRKGEEHDIDALKHVAIDPITEKFGYTAGDAMPTGFKAAANRLAQRMQLNWSKTQAEKGATGVYNTALQDFGRFMVADTVYTLITALTIRPFVKLLRFIPFMSYKPKVPANSAVLDGDQVKVPPNRYADVATDTLNRDPSVTEEKRQERSEASMPSHKIHQAQHQEHVAPRHSPELAGAGA